MTQPDSDESEESSDEDLATVDGGKLSKRTKRKVQAIVNEKYIFPSMNILLYAENYIFPQASAPVVSEANPDGIEESNRETLYNLYNMALDLEPEPRYPEPTFT